LTARGRPRSSPPRAQDDVTFRPLEGTRVLDISRLYPGALATLKLADLGADVVKVEEPGRGDYMRTIPPLINGEGVLHLLLDRGKRSVELDLRTDSGRQGFLRLLSVADVLVEGSRPGRFTELGIDFADLRHKHPHLIVCSVSGFGQTGPLSGAPSHGMNMDALAGVLVLSKWSDRTRFVPMGFSLGVEMGAVNAALGIAAALHQVRATGEGVWIDASCWDGAFELQRMPIGSHLGGGEQLELREPRPLYDLYETSDGKLVLFCAIERKFWDGFCKGIGREDLSRRWSGTDVDFGSDPGLRAELEKIFADRTAAEWEDCFGRFDIPGSAVLNLTEALQHPHAQARALVRDRGIGMAPFVANPLRWHDRDERPGDGASAPPRLGEHTTEVFEEWLG
jgi:alpha-methylacyl-CoA racemase